MALHMDMNSNFRHPRLCSLSLVKNWPSDFRKKKDFKCRKCIFAFFFVYLLLVKAMTLPVNNLELFSTEE